jgi:hypothetical protein
LANRVGVRVTGRAGQTHDVALDGRKGWLRCQIGAYPDNKMLESAGLFVKFLLIGNPTV